MQSKNKLLSIFIFAGMLAATFSPATSIPTYEVVFVDDSSLGDNHFDTIPNALGAVLPGGTMYIAAGHYVLSSSLYIDFDLTIIGEGSDVVLIESDTGLFDVISVKDANFEISGCSVTGGGNGIYIDSNMNTISIHDNVIYLNGSKGIYVSLAGNVEGDGGFDGGPEPLSSLYVSSNEIYDNGAEGVGINCTDSYCDVYVNYNEIYDNGGPGIELVGATSLLWCEMDSNIIFRNGSFSGSTGIHVYELIDLYMHLEISNNTIYDENHDGIMIDINTTALYNDDYASYDDRVLVYGNDIYGSVGHGINVSSDLEMAYMPLIAIMDGSSNDYYPDYISIYDNAIHDNSFVGIRFYFDVYLSYPTSLVQVDGAMPDNQYSVVVAENEIYGNGIVGIDAYTEVTMDIMGEGVGLDGFDGTPNYFMWVYRNEIYGNNDGGILFNHMGESRIENNLIVGNFSMPELDGPGGMGSAIYMVECQQVEVLNNTMIANLNGIIVDHFYTPPIIVNNIIASNMLCGIEVRTNGGTGLDGNGYGPIAFNDVWNNDTNYAGIPDLTGMDGNISEDPQFYGMFDARLLQISPCIDTGHPETIGYVTEDIDGTPRPMGQGIDMGCYEMYNQVWSPRYIQPLAIMSTAKANSMWGCIMQNLPSELDAEVEALLEDVQGLMGKAGSLSNPIYTNGLMQQALALMENINEILECGCHS